MKEANITRQLQKSQAQHYIRKQIQTSGHQKLLQQKQSQLSTYLPAFITKPPSRDRRRCLDSSLDKGELTTLGNSVSDFVKTQAIETQDKQIPCMHMIERFSKQKIVNVDVLVEQMKKNRRNLRSKNESRNKYNFTGVQTPDQGIDLNQTRVMNKSQINLRQEDSMKQLPGAQKPFQLVTKRFLDESLESISTLSKIKKDD